MNDVVFRNCWGLGGLFYNGLIRMFWCRVCLENGGNRDFVLVLYLENLLLKKIVFLYDRDIVN